MPPVTSTEPKPKQPKPTGAERAENASRMAYGANRRRPVTFAPDGYPEPTELEIEEGEAHKDMTQRPNSKMLAEEWKQTYIRLYETEGMPATTRCLDCHVVKFGRPYTVPCGHCGCTEVYEYRRLGE